MKYTAEMIDFLREKAREISDRAEITRLFNERFGTSKKKGAIKTALWRLGESSYRKYTPEMISFICEEDGNCRSRKELTRLFNEKFDTQKTPAHIHGVLWRRGMQADWEFRYTKEMDDFIYKHHGMTYYELAKLFNKTFKTNKTVVSIAHRCRGLGLRCSKEIICRANQKYRQDELDFVREKLPHVKTREELANLFNEYFHDRKTKRSINYVVRRYFPNFINNMPYTKEMDAFLKANASPDISYAILTKMFNETFKVQIAIPTISAKCLRMGLSCGRGADAELLVPCDRDKTNNSPDNMEIMTRGEFQALVGLGMYSEEPEVTKAGIALVRLTRRLKELQKKRKG